MMVSSFIHVTDYDKFFPFM